MAVAVGCARTPPTPDRVEVLLDGSWSDPLWATPAAPVARGGGITTSTRFQIPEVDGGLRADLLLEGLWWSADVVLDGVAVGRADGGVGPVTFPLADGLAPGSHTLELTIRPPTGLHRFLVGGVPENGGSMDRPALRGPPRLVLRPADGVSSAGVRFDGRRATAWAQVDQPREGLQVRWYTALDGRRRTDLGVAPVDPVTGRADGPPSRLREPPWGWGDPALSHLNAVLEDVSGNVLDTWVVRSGIRSARLLSTGLQVGDFRSPVVGLRVVDGDRAPSLLQSMHHGARAGINAVEVHGDTPLLAWMELTDELGLPMVVMPRCIGRTGSLDYASGPQKALMEDQDRRIVRAVGAHPSVVAWVTEGGQRDHQGRPGHGARVEPWTSVLEADPMGRQVAGVSPRATLVRTTDLENLRYECPGGCSGRWLVEMTFPGGGRGEPWSLLAQAWVRAVQEGGPGGVVPKPARLDNDLWRRSFEWASRSVGATAWPLERRRRAPARVRVRGARPGDIVFVSAPGIRGRGHQAGADGLVEIDVWHAGVATVHGPGWQREVRLDARRWEGLQRWGRVTELTAPTASNTASPPRQ